MRHIFAETLEKIGKKDREIIFLTGDLGFNAFEKLRAALGDRFINAGVAEHNMVTAAAGLAYTGLKPWVYSIAPFVTIKVIEEIRNDICLSNANVKIVGIGGGYDYALAGPTHHALQDISVMLTLPNMKVYIPAFVQDINPMVNLCYRQNGPTYLRLTKAESSRIFIPRYAAVRKLASGNRMTVVALGSIVHKVIPALNRFPEKVDLFVVSELPFTFSSEMINSIKTTRSLCVIEEHVKTGGLGEFIASELINRQMAPKWSHIYAKGYVSGRYGSREFYLKETGLDSDSITRAISNNMRIRS